MQKLNQKDVAAILYMYYMNNYCEDDFSFDKGKLKELIESYYNKLTKNLSEEDLNIITHNIKVYNQEGSDYDSLIIKYIDMPDLFLQVTSLIDYNGNKVNGYNGDSKYADVSMFFVDYIDVDFNDLA